MTRELIVCPADPHATLAMSRARWGAGSAGMTPHFLDQRRLAIQRYRSECNPNAAERYGWLTLAGIAVHLSPRASLGLDPAKRFDFRDTLIIPIAQTLPCTITLIPGTNLPAVDPRDGFGLWLADLAADAAAHAVVTVNGSAISSAIVTETLARILSN